MPVPEDALLRFEQLILKRLEQGSPFPEAMLIGYKAFLCSSHFLYLHKPSDPATSDLAHYAIAVRLSHFLANTRPDQALMALAAAGKLRDAKTLRSKTERLIDSPGFDRFVRTSPITGSTCETSAATSPTFGCILSIASMIT